MICQLIYYFSDMWQFTLGARYTWEEKTIKQDNFISTAPGNFIATRDEFSALADFVQPLEVHPDKPTQKEKDDWSEVSPSATVTMFAPESWTGEFLNSAMFYLT